ncbi:hypothetical protein C8Q73DRAFT_661185 [Cubamyces lactineus]|nr:hypothetical protein C8Q73DRAFT_661185 [Cubamyces lactineus]
MWLANTMTLARDLWPKSIGRLIQEGQTSIDNLPSARKIPTTPEALAEWLCVEPMPSQGQAAVYIRSDVPGVAQLNEGSTHDDPLELVIRLQGVIADMNLNVGGDWDGSVDNVMRAKQHLSLIGGGCKAAFEPQESAVNAIRELVLVMLGKSEELGRGRPGTITLRRRVFTKIRHGVNDDLPNVVRASEDPKKRFHDIRHSWRVTERVTAGVQQADGQINVIPPLTLRRGDFVDVSVRVNVAMMRTAQGPRYEVLFEPLTVVKLLAASAVMVSTISVIGNVEELMYCGAARISGNKERTIAVNRSGTSGGEGEEIHGDRVQINGWGPGGGR